MNATDILPTSARPTLLGPLSLASLLGKEPRDARSLNLAGAPVHLLERGSRYTLLFGEALGRRGLMDLLFTLAPYKAHGPDRFARVLDNWGIFDRAKANGASNNLFQQHVKSLQANWRTFGEHRDLYMQVFQDQSEQTRVLPVLGWEKDSDGKRHWLADGLEPEEVALLEPAIRGISGPNSPALDSLLGLVAVPYLLPELSRRWPAWRPLVRDGKSNYIGPASVPVMALLHRRSILNSVLVQNTEAALDAASWEP